MKNRAVKRAFLETLPVMAGYIVLGMGFGIILKSKGYGVWWSLAMSMFIYAGSMQYLAVDLLSGGATLITTAITTLMVNARHLFYAVSMVDKYRNTGKKKPYLIYALTDETYSLVCKDSIAKDENSHRLYFLISLFNQIYWVTGCVLGSLIGIFVKFNVEGIDFALTALFVTVFIDQWLTHEEHTSAITGGLSSLICLLIFGSKNFLIPSMILITIVLTVIKVIIKKEKENG